MPSPYLYAKYRSRIEMHESFPPRVTAKDFENAPKVFNLLQGHEKACRGTRHLSLFGHEVCNKGWMKLVGIGKRRFLRIFNAVKNNEAVCPLDQRFIPREPKPPSVKRQAVYDFLHRLYEQAAEHLPDSNHSSSNKRPRQAKYKYDDPNMDRRQVRHLPPGKFMDYLRLCRLENPDFKISKKLFSNVTVSVLKISWSFVIRHYCDRSLPTPFDMTSPISNPCQVWMMDFQSRLRIRQQGHHGKCSTCVRHRLIIKRLGRGPARTAQLLLYKSHLSRQYKDRQTYWGHRAQSRTEATSGQPITTLSMIVDGMDQAKHAYPKGEALSAKEFSAWVRPRLQATTVIAHGHGILVGLSPQNTSSSGSRTVELIAYMMTKQLQYIHWPNVFLRLEADNCSKEIKHQTSLRMMASMICLHRLRGCEMNFLSSGHSHEDIDAHFALTSSYLDRFPELWCIDDFQKCLASMLENKTVRPHEPHREVVVFDRFHDWTSDETQ